MFYILPKNGVHQRLVHAPCDSFIWKRYIVNLPNPVDNFLTESISASVRNLSAEINLSNSQSIWKDSDICSRISGLSETTLPSF